MIQTQKSFTKKRSCIPHKIPGVALLPSDIDPRLEFDCPRFFDFTDSDVYDYEEPPQLFDWF
jgi:hypothetical protein